MLRLGAWLVLWLATVAPLGATTYYLHPLLGDDKNPGTSELAPFKTLARANHLSLQAGDRVLLAAGQQFDGQLSFQSATGTAKNEILLSTYPGHFAGGDGRALIVAKGLVAGVYLENCAFLTVANLQITANGGGMAPGQPGKPDQRYGVLITASQPGEWAGITLTNLLVRDVFYEEPGFIRTPGEIRTANGTQSYGWGIEFLILNAAASIRQVQIEDCEIRNVSHTGLQFAGPHHGLRHLEVRQVKLSHTGGPGVQMSGVTEAHFSGLEVNGSGSTNDMRNWQRGSGLWTWDSDNVVIEQSRFQNANGPGDSCGVHIDFNCRNVIVQKNFSANNAGGFCEILGNNYNCAYRYNVSVNDGWRIKGLNGALQEGKTFWLSGYVGGKKQLGPFNTYFYNNTLFVRSNIAAKIAVSPTASGILIANNIFYIEGASHSVKGDQTRADANNPAHSIPGVVFQNNLFLHRDNWPAALSLQDQHPLIGDPHFQNRGGLSLEDYRPSNRELVKNAGVTIAPIPQDQFGLLGGLKMEQDILGQPIVGPPDLGAIEMQ